MVSTYTLLSFGPYRVFLFLHPLFFYELSFVILRIRPYEPWIHRVIRFNEEEWEKERPRRSMSKPVDEWNPKSAFIQSPL